MSKLPTKSFIDRWLYDVGHILTMQLEALREFLDSEDEHTRERAAQDIHEILAWLYGPPAPLSDGEKQLRILKLLQAGAGENVSSNGQLAAIRRVARSTGRPRGRPRTETAQHAIAALSLFYATSLSWREIALRVKDCTHPRPHPEQRSCRYCGDAVRDAAGRLEKFLRSKGYHPEVPRRLELGRASDREKKPQG